MYALCTVSKENAKIFEREHFYFANFQKKIKNYITNRSTDRWSSRGKPACRNDYAICKDPGSNPTYNQ